MRDPLQAVLTPANADRAPAVTNHLLDQAAGLQPQIWALERRLQKGAGGGPSAAAALVDVECTRAFIVAAVEVGDTLDTGLLRGGAKGIQQIPAHARRRNVPFAADGMRLARTKKMVFMALEIGQHVIPAPAIQAELPPMIVVGGLPAHIDHRVDRG